MQKLKDLIRSPHIQIALAAGASIIAIAYFSKRVLPEPIGYLPSAIPPFIAVVFEGVLNKHKDKKIATTRYWVAAILLATAVVIIFYALKFV